MKLFYHAIGLLAAFCLMFAVLITSVEAVVYWNDGYFEKEYRKYGVLERVQMEMDDLLYVTDEMMDYLRGGREDLDIEAEIAGRLQEFFNEKEKRHMVDVKGLFHAGQGLRAGGLLAAAVIALFLLWRRQRDTLLRMLQWGVGLFLAAMAALALLASASFTKYFTQFHLIFFDNDDWILNPATDRLINIVPEGFFRDTAFLIAAVFLAAAFVLWLAAGLLRKKYGNRGML